MTDVLALVAETGVTVPDDFKETLKAADKEAFESIRQGSDLDRVIENCKLINAYCDEAGVLRTKMWNVVQRKNVDQLEALVDLAKDAGFANMVFSLDMHGWANDELFARNREQMVEEMVDIDRLFGLIEQGRALGSGSTRCRRVKSCIDDCGRRQNG